MSRRAIALLLILKKWGRPIEEESEGGAAPEDGQGWSILRGSDSFRAAGRGRILCLAAFFCPCGN